MHSELRMVAIDDDSPMWIRCSMRAAVAGIFREKHALSGLCLTKVAWRDKTFDEVVCVMLRFVGSFSFDVLMSVGLRFC